MCDSPKATRSYGISSEPIKSIVNAITLSSLDTLNDIDSEEDDQCLNDQQLPSQILKQNDENERYPSDDFDEFEERDTGNYHEIEDDEGEEVYNVYAKSQNENDLLTTKIIEKNIIDGGEYYRKHVKALNREQMPSQHQNSNQQHYLEQKMANAAVAGMQMFDQDWSYSQNSNNTYSHSVNTNNNLFSHNTALNSNISGGYHGFAGQSSGSNLDTQKIINEIVRKLKPYIMRCVKKEVRNCFDKYQNRKESSGISISTKNSKYNDSSMTKIGDF